LIVVLSVSIFVSIFALLDVAFEESVSGFVVDVFLLA
jgi:preprotein translocase subunit SecE